MLETLLCHSPGCSIIEDMRTHFDVIVSGGGPAGIAAAIQAARLGADTLLLEKNAFVGGCAASGLPFLNFFNKKGEQVIRGIGDELVSRLQGEKAALPHVLTRGGHVDSITMIDPEWVKICAEEMLLEAGVHLLYESFVCGTEVKDGAVASVLVANKAGLTSLSAQCFVDATGDADLAAFSGAAFDYGRDGDHEAQAMSLVARVANVEVEKVSAAFPVSPIVTAPLGADRAYNLHVTGKLGKWNDVLREMRLFDHDDHDFWGGTTRDGELTYVNVTRVAHLNPTDPEEHTAANIEARRQLKGMMRFFNRYIGGMERAYIASTPNGIGIRETRRIRGVRTLTEEDVLSGREFPDSIAKNGYCIDIHDPSGKSWGARFIQGADGCYGIPYGCLVPEKTDGLLVAGRPISATHEAQGSIRIMPACMATGQAAGAAAALSAKTGLRPRDLDVPSLRETLRQAGAVI